MLALPGLSAATDYPLMFKTLDAQQAMSFAPGATTYAMIQTVKPAGIVKAPPATSNHPLYGEIAAGSDQLLFRLDESKGNGTGYDRMIVDVNRNGDLTDDPVAGLVPRANGLALFAGPTTMLFGPIQAPEKLKIGADRPVFYAQVYLFMAPGSISGTSLNSTVGEVLPRPGWYLEAKVEVNGKQHKVDLVDANCNFHLGDPERPTKYQSGVNASESSWLFSGGDSILVDRDGSGGVASTLVQDQSSSFGPVFYLDAKPYKVTLSADFKTLSLDAWPGPLAELALQPHGEQVSSLDLAWEQAPGDWVLLHPGVEKGKAQVPPGNYRLYSVQMKAKTASGESLLLTGTKRVPEGGIKAVGGVTTPLQCGAPLQIVLTAQATRAASSGGILGSLFGQAGPAQIIQASIVGAGGESYSAPYLISEKGALRTPPGPTFAVLTADGKQVDSGSLEYG